MRHSIPAIGAMILFSAVLNGVMPTVAIAQSRQAPQTQRTYTPAEFVAVLNGLGYPVADTDSIDAPTVQQAIRDFQSRYQLTVDGVLGPRTQEKAATVVKLLQANLNKVLKLNPPLPVSPFYGPQTQAAVEQFQKRFNLPVTGIASWEVRNLLNEKATGKPAANASTTRSTTQANPTTPSSSEIYARPEDFRSVLVGLGYDIPSQGPLIDAPTQTALRDFQAEYGLPTNGVADRATQERAAQLVRNLKNNLKLVLKLKSPLPITPLYDTTTREVVKQFQDQFRFPVTGIATLEIRQELDAAAKRVLGQ